MRNVFRLVLALALTSAVVASAQPKKPRIAVGGLRAESNSLYPKAQPMRELSRTISRQAWIEENLKASETTSGILAGAQEVGLDVYPVLHARAISLGYVEKASFNRLLDTLVEQIKTASPPFDGVILTLHGAMVVDGYPHGDAEVTRRVREAMGDDFPIIVTQDFHANVSEEIVKYSDVLITYKDTPHLDPKERGIQAATIMAGMIRGEINPVQAIVKPPMIVNLLYHNTFAPPYKPVTDESRRLENTNPKILAASVPGGYQWSDVPAMGPSVIVVTDNDLELAEREAKRLGDMLWAMRDQLEFKVPDVATAVRNAIASDEFPVVLMDTGDNIGGGSAGDATFILSELLRQKAEGWVVVISDPEANKVAFEAGIGGAFDQMVGGKTDKIHGDPVRVTGLVKALHDGKYGETCQGRSKFGPLRRSKSRPVGEGVAVFVGRLERSLRSPFRAAQA